MRLFLVAILLFTVVPGFCSEGVTITIERDDVIFWGKVGMAGSGFLLWSGTGMMYPFAAGCCFLYSAVMQPREGRHEKHTVFFNPDGSVVH